MSLNFLLYFLYIIFLP
uniref:Uncharacterized protein n=1 Tax=Rhizophora mucronata TaxID=61149 RepID=A0A2P2J1W7_RHIMU